MVAAGDQRRSRRRAQRRGAELRVTQTRVCDAVQRRRRDNATEGTTHAVTLVVGHDEQHIGRALWRHHPRRPPRFGVLGALLDHSAEFRGWWRELFAVDGDRGAWRPRRSGGLLGHGSWQITCSEKKAQRKCCRDLHCNFSLLTVLGTDLNLGRRRRCTSRRRCAACYLPPPLAPFWTICSARSMLSDPPTWLGGYSLNVRRNRPTMLTPGTMVQSLSPHQRAYIIDSS